MQDNSGTSGTLRSPDDICLGFMDFIARFSFLKTEWETFLKQSPQNVRKNVEKFGSEWNLCKRIRHQTKCFHDGKKIPTGITKTPDKLISDDRAKKAILKAVEYCKRQWSQSDRKVWRNDISKHLGDGLFLFRNLYLMMEDKPALKKHSKAMVELLECINENYDKYYTEKRERDIDFLEGYHCRSALKPICEEVANQRIQVEEWLQKVTKTDKGRKKLFPTEPSDRPPKTPYGQCTNCHAYTERPKRKCAACGFKMEQVTDYHQLSHMFIWSATLDDLNLIDKYFPAHYKLESLISLLPYIRPYQDINSIGKAEFKEQCYFITHLLFVSSRSQRSWGVFALDPRHFVEEFIFLFYAMEICIELEDNELVGEICHCLRLFGVNDENMVLCNGVTFLLKQEAYQANSAKKKRKAQPTFYSRYHTAYCEILAFMKHGLFTLRSRRKAGTFEWKFAEVYATVYDSEKDSLIKPSIDPSSLLHTKAQKPKVKVEPLASSPKPKVKVEPIASSQTPKVKVEPLASPPSSRPNRKRKTVTPDSLSLPTAKKRKPSIRKRKKREPPIKLLPVSSSAQELNERENARSQSPNDSNESISDRLLQRKRATPTLKLSSSPLLPEYLEQRPFAEIRQCLKPSIKKKRYTRGRVPPFSRTTNTPSPSSPNWTSGIRTRSLLKKENVKSNKGDPVIRNTELGRSTLKILEQLKTSNQIENTTRMRFYQDLTEFLEREPDKKVLGRVYVDLSLLYSLVVENGGFAAVNREKLWSKILRQMPNSAQCSSTSASSRLKKMYSKNLLEYERQKMPNI